MTDIPTLRLKCMQQARDEGYTGDEQTQRAESLFEFAMMQEAVKDPDDWKEPRSPSFDDLKAKD